MKSYLVWFGHANIFSSKLTIFFKVGTWCNYDQKCKKNFCLSTTGSTCQLFWHVHFALLKMCHPNWLSLTIDRKIDLNLKYPFKTFTPKLETYFLGKKIVLDLLSLKWRRNSVFGYVMLCVIKINSNTCQKCHTYRIVGKYNNNMLALMQQLYKSECILITYSWKYLLVSKFKYILTLCR